MRKQKEIIGIGLALIMLGCGAEKTDSKSVEPVEEAAVEQVCMYTINTEKSEVLWTAYKYNQKTGVKGKFGSFMIEGAIAANSKIESLQDASINIDVESIDSGDPTRDPKILEHFFGSFQEGSSITGAVKSIDESAQTLTVAITMNSVTMDVEGAYTISEDVVEVKMELNVNDWGAEAAIAALNEACEDLHKGSDGESILWPDVSVIIVAPLTKTCE